MNNICIKIVLIILILIIITPFSNIKNFDANDY